MRAIDTALVERAVRQALAEEFEPARCRDCHRDVRDEWFMVHDEVWPLGYHDGNLCVGCLEGRIGRQLTPADFTDAMCNKLDHPNWLRRLPGYKRHSARLRSRLRGDKA